MTIKLKLEPLFAFKTNCSGNSSILICFRLSYTFKILLHISFFDTLFEYSCNKILSAQFIFNFVISCIANQLILSPNVIKLDSS